MEAFSLLKYWRGGGSLGPALNPSSHTTNATATVLTAVTQHENATDSDEDCAGASAGGDDGPFFDLEFTVPDEVDDSEENAHENPNANNSSNNSNTEHHSDGDEGDDNDDDTIEECEREFKFTLSPSSNDRSSDDPNLSLSPSENLYFKGKLVQVEEPSSSSSEPNVKPQFTASLFKSATKFRVFMLGLKKPKPNNAASSSDKDSDNGSDSVPPEPQKKQQQPAERKHFTVKFKVEEVPIISLFTRDNSSKGGNKKHNPEESPSSSSEEKRLSSSKEAMKNKYLKMVKPLYIRVTRRNGAKLGFSGQLSLSSSAGRAIPPHDTADKKGSPAKADAESDSAGGENREANAKSQKLGNVPSGIRIACKRLGKSRSASSAVAAAPPPALLSSNRRDDSLLQQQDGIQGAILHCKRSFNASRSESESCDVACPVVSEMMMTSEVSRNSINKRV